MLVVDLGGSKDTRKILHDLNEAFSSGESGIRDALGRVNQDIAEAACRAMEHGDAETLGTLMTGAQEVFDRLLAPHCPEELASPLLHSLLNHPGVAPFVWGGKGVGSQGDGSAQFVCRGPVERDMLIHMLRKELGLSSLELTIPSGCEGRP
jgi:hypothetical protein